MRVVGWPLAISGAAFAAAFAGNNEDAGPQTLLRLGTLVALTALLWAIARWFGPTVLRISAVGAALVIVLFMMWTGEEQRKDDDAERYLERREIILEDQKTLVELEAAANAVEQARSAAAAAQEALDVAGEASGAAELDEAREGADAAADLAEDAATAVAGGDTPSDPGEPVDSSAEAAGNAQPAGFLAVEAFEEALSAADGLVLGCDRDIVLKLKRKRPVDPQCEPRTALRRLLETQRAELVVAEVIATEDARQEALANLRADIDVELDALQEAVAVHRLAIDGADAVVGDLANPLMGDDVTARVGGWGWAVLVVLLVVAYRQLEIVNARRDVGPAIVAPGESPSAALEEEAKLAGERIRMWLGLAELREPAAVPGGEATHAVAEMLQDEGSPASASLRWAVGLLQGTAFPQRGYQVTPVLEPITTPSPTAERERPGSVHRVAQNRLQQWYRLTVRVTELRTKRLVDLNAVDGPDLEQLAEQSGHWVARLVLARSDLVPSWATWQSEYGADIGAFQQVALDDRTERDRLTPEERERLLHRAIGFNPRSGLAHAALASIYTLDLRLAQALEHLVVARTDHPRFTVAGYRLAAVASMISQDPSAHWPSEEPMARTSADDPESSELSDAPETRRRLAKLLLRAKLVNQSDHDRLAAEDTRVDRLARIHRKIARRELRRLKRMTWLPVAAWYALAEPSERAHWMGLVRNRKRRVAQRIGIRSLLAIVALRQAIATGNAEEIPELAQQVTDRADSNHEDALVSYNAACFLALWYQHELNTASARQAVSRLEDASAARDGDLISVGWMSVDPDLESIRGLHEYETLHRILTARDELRSDGA